VKSSFDVIMLTIGALLKVY